MEDITLKERERLKKLGEISNKINSLMELPELLEVIMAAAKEVLNTEGASLLLMDNEKKELYFDVALSVVGKKVKEIRIPLGKGIAGICAEKGISIIVNDAQNDDRVYKEVDEKSNFVTRNLLCVPMKVKEKLVGVLEVVNTIGRNEFNDNDLILMEYLADQAAIAIHNRELFDNLKKANQELKERVEELTCLYEISYAISFKMTVNELFEESLKSIKNNLGIEKSCFIIYDRHKNEYVIKAHLGFNEKDIQEMYSDINNGIAKFALKYQDPLLILNKDVDLKIHNYSNLLYDSPSFLIVPLRYQNFVEGLFIGFRKKNNINFDSFDFRVITSISQQIVNSYHNVLLNEELLEKYKLEKELEIAGAIQRKILPRDFSNASNLDITAYTFPRKTIGGDFYDFINYDNENYGFIVADVAGEGISAALFMAFSRNLIRSEVRTNKSTSLVLHEVNNLLYKDSEAGVFVTLCFVKVDTKNKVIYYSNAGHEDQILFRSKEKKIEFLKASGRPLGVIENSDYEENILSYNNGDFLILFTDGVIEASNYNEEEFGIKRLVDLIINNNCNNSREMFNLINKNVLDFTKKDFYDDDFTMLIVKL